MLNSLVFSSARRVRAIRGFLPRGRPHLFREAAKSNNRFSSSGMSRSNVSRPEMDCVGRVRHNLAVIDASGQF